LGIQDLGFGIEDLGFEIGDWGLKIWDLGLDVYRLDVWGASTWKHGNPIHFTFGVGVNKSKI